MTSERNPFKEIERLFEQMTQQFDDSGGLPEAAPFGSTKSISVDVAEDDDEYVVTADLPGFEKDQIDVRVIDRRLRIEADAESETEDRDETYLRNERRRRSVQRSISLPGMVDEENATASYRNGVLTVTLPKADPDSAGQSLEVE